jgi:hypothetical protein
MQRVVYSGLFAFVTVFLWLGLGEPGRGQAPGAPPPVAPAQPVPPPGGEVQPPGGPIPPGVPVPPGGGPIPPVVGGGGGGFLPPAAGNLGIGDIPITPPIGYAYPIRSVDWNMGRFSYYPYYYFPHNYWPQQSCPWPERPGQPYMRPPAYMAYPPFMEPHWRYEWYVPQRWYRGFHFWLDQF